MITVIGFIRIWLREFEVKERNQVWVADITYIRILTGFVYLAVVLDLFSRKVIGWALSEHIDAELTLAALRMALEERGSVKGCIHHSDRGVQYACHAYVEELHNPFQPFQQFKSSRSS